MQATATVKQAQRNQIRIAVIILMLLGVLGAGVAVAAITRSGDAAPGSNGSALVEPKTNVDFRFLEMNMLPEAAAVRPMSYQRYRFLEMNILPEAAQAPVVSFERWRFLEMNTLPGDDASMIAPFSDQRGVPY